MAEGRADFTPVFLYEVSRLFEDGTLPLDVAFVRLSPPDDHGFCRLGVACARSAVEVDRTLPVMARQPFGDVQRVIGGQMDFAQGSVPSPGASR